MSGARLRRTEVIEVNGCGCCGWWPGAGRGPAREDQIKWLQEYQRDLEQQAARVAEEIRRLQEAQQPAS